MGVLINQQLVDSPPPRFWNKNGEGKNGEERSMGRIKQTKAAHLDISMAIRPDDS